MTQTHPKHLTYGIEERISLLVSKIVAPNPGPYTNTGTCTYLVGHNSLAIIDPGPDNDAHLRALVKAIGTRSLKHILVTHTHKDHSPLARRLSAMTGVPVWGCSPHFAARPLYEDEINWLEGSADLHHDPERIVEEGDVIASPDYTLQTLSTPGHTMNHLAFALLEEKALFSGDHVMGWSTTIVAPPDGHMATYMASLSKIRQRDDLVYYPGHGEPVRNPKKLVRGIFIHRKQRERSILKRLRAGDTLIGKIVDQLYEHLSPQLKNGAALSVLAHLEHLIDQKLVQCAGQPMLNSVYELKY